MSQSTLPAEVDDALERCSFGRDEDVLAAPPALEGVYQVNTSRDGNPIYVPLVEIDHETTDDPDLDTVYRIVAEIVRTVHPVFRDEHVRHYDVVFAYGETSLWDWEGEQRRVAVRPRQAERLTREPDFGPAALRDRLEELDDGDDEIPPVAWGETLAEWEYYRDDGDWSIGFMGGM
ncbi:hypothetical protein [Halobiforma nitratireducens]|uniref:Uncharacterized protein n=1 Tax=Halobiforma nitratireducens JCM 10879 TaxID=1227454 RepID=M0M8S8_9EURY|nr:hypothetical protein [Halobiforma nitratireducens]EMA41753.1 hypothetical protein C446_05540 [Halobiforma nitratireducens JCM 10879]